MERKISSLYFSKVPDFIDFSRLGVYGVKEHVMIANRELRFRS